MPTSAAAPAGLARPPGRPVALTIAGSDPTGGAGLQADLQVFHARGVHGAAVVTALTVQDTARVHQTLPVFPSVVLDQLRVVLRDMPPAAIKIGMLGTDDVARNVLLCMTGLEGIPLVIDPVLAASDGSPLLERRAIGTLRALMRGATLVTPNLDEAQALTGCDASSRAGAEQAARILLEEHGVRAVLLKGGHREGAPHDLLAVRDPGAEAAAGTDERGAPHETDAAAAVELHWLAGERIGSSAVHGTGCALSAAITAGLARGEPLLDAVAAARELVARGLRQAHAPGQGARLLDFG